jgi:hypothetical protein
MASALGTMRSQSSIPVRMQVFISNVTHFKPRMSDGPATLASYSMQRSLPWGTGAWLYPRATAFNPFAVRILAKTRRASALSALASWGKANSNSTPSLRVLFRSAMSMAVSSASMGVETADYCSGQ